MTLPYPFPEEDHQFDGQVNLHNFEQSDMIQLSTTANGSYSYLTHVYQSQRSVGKPQLVSVTK